MRQHNGSRDDDHAGDSHGHGHGHDSLHHDHQHEHVHSVGAPSTDRPGSQFKWNVHHPVDGKEDRAAVEVGPWSGLLPRWRFVVPADFKRVVRWGIGPAGTNDFSESDVRRPVGGEDVQLHDGPAVDWMGGHNALSKKLSAFLVFDGDPPHWMAFGQADEPDGPPTNLEGIYFASHPPPHPAHDD